MATLERPLEIAVEAHREQKDKAGAPYILHPLRVTMSFDSEPEMIVGVLHDVLEDSTWTATQLREEGFSRAIVAAIECLTKVGGESYEQFVQRSKTNPLAGKVKIADLQDNMNMSRIGKVTDSDLRRLRRYHQAWRILTRSSGPE